MAWKDINLFGYDPEQIDFSKTTFNIKQALNNNWTHLKELIVEIRGRIESGEEKIEKLKEIVPIKATIITGTLSTGQTALTLSDSAITTDSVIDIYTDHWGVSPSEVTVETGQINMTFNELDYALNVRAEVR